MVLSVKNMTFGYQGPPLLEDVNFEIAPGDFAAIIGANGAGKSTLLRLILGEIAPQKGEILLFGTPAPSFRAWRDVAFLPQNTAQGAFSFPATALEVVSGALYPGFLRFGSPKKRREEALAALDLTGMKGSASSLMGTLSGGERQRVLLARALAANPRLVILDEPASGVDSLSVERFTALLEKLNRERGLTVIMVTHDIARMIYSVNRILCIEEGNLLEIDRAQIERELVARHTHSPAGGRHNHNHGGNDGSL